MRRLDLIITQVRQQTENEDFSDTTGIRDNEMVQFANDAQEKIHARIRDVYPAAFIKQGTIASVANQEAYSLPTDCFLDNSLVNVEYSADSTEEGFYPLDRISFKERVSFQAGNPDGYIPRTNKILLAPVPNSSSGTIRLNYVFRLPTIDKRRGKISAVTLNSGTQQITSITLDTNETIDATDLVNNDYMCIVDRFGAIKMAAVLIDAVDGSTGAVTVNSSFVYASGETAAAGDYVVSGKYATTHAQLPETCERYLISYMAWKVFRRDSNTDSGEQSGELQEMLSDIVSAFGSSITEDVQRPAILDNTYMSLTDDY